jgi:hypothetical protein
MNDDNGDVELHGSDATSFWESINNEEDGDSTHFNCNG